MTLQVIGSQFTRGGSGLTDGTLKNAITELQGLSVTPVTGAAANAPMSVPAIRSEDTIVAALLTSATVTLGVAEVQSLTVNATSGNYTISFGGDTTDSIAFDATASAVQAALELLTSITAGDVVVSGGPGDGTGSAPYVLTWDSRLGAVAEITAASVDLAGGTSSATPGTTTPGQQQLGGGTTDIASTITINSTAASGTVTVSGLPVADDTVTVNGVDYTYKAAADVTSVTHVAISTDDAPGYLAMATSLATAINAYETRLLANGAGYNSPAVVATVELGVTTVTSVVEGAGNGPVVSRVGSPITLDATDAGAVTATFVSAINGNSVTVNGTTFTVKTTPVDLDVDMGVKASDTLQAAELVRAITAYQNKYGNLGVAASSLLGVVTLTASTARTGNSITLSELATNVAASGSGYLAGGSAAGGITSNIDLAGETITLFWYNRTA